METIKKDGFNLVRQTDGPDLGYSPTSGVKIIEVDGKAFKSLTAATLSCPMRTGVCRWKNALPTLHRG